MWKVGDGNGDIAGCAPNGTNFNVISPIDVLSVLLRQSNAPVLQGGEDGGGHVDVVRVLPAVREQPPCQQPARLYGQRGQLQLPLEDVSYHVDVGNIGLLKHARNISTPVERGGGGDGKPIHQLYTMCKLQHTCPVDKLTSYESDVTCTNVV